jgi:hypothetical protein
MDYAISALRMHAVGCRHIRFSRVTSVNAVAVPSGTLADVRVRVPVFKIDSNCVSSICRSEGIDMMMITNLWRNTIARHMTFFDVFDEK